MALQIITDEQYILLIPDAQDVATLAELEDAIIKKLEEERTGFIIDLQKVDALTSEAQKRINSMNDIVSKEEGLLVVCSVEGDNAQVLKNSGIVNTRTLDEAVDYIFMEEIEKQFKDDDEDDWLSDLNEE
jgi:anti-anti-sigma regulatory factor